MNAKLDTEVVPFTAGDGRPLNLVHVVGAKQPTRGPVLLVHGAGVRGNIFRPPVDTNLVDLLVAEGYDVWLENWRASIDLEPTEWTLDQAAVYDHPQAVRTVLERSSADDLQAIIHCQGSTSFTMSVVAGLVPEVRTVITNAVSLHPVIPWFSYFKLYGASPLVARLTPYMNPQWGDGAPKAWLRAMVRLVLLFHHECHNNVCKMVSFTYGTGFPCLWEHYNLNDQTHEWVRQEFANVPFTFFSQMAKCVSRGHLVSVDDHPELPKSFVAQRPQTDARFVFLSGERNRCFRAESQKRTFAFFDGHNPGRHSLHVFPRYGHLDIFMGQRAAIDIAPTILKELDR